MSSEVFKLLREGSYLLFFSELDIWGVNYLKRVQKMSGNVDENNMHSSKVAARASLVKASLKFHSFILLPLPSVQFDKNTHFTHRTAWKGSELMTIYISGWFLKVKF